MKMNILGSEINIKYVKKLSEGFIISISNFLIGT